jgi:hypothetical protein
VLGGRAAMLFRSSRLLGIIREEVWLGRPARAIRLYQLPQSIKTKRVTIESRTKRATTAAAMMMRAMPGAGSLPCLWSVQFDEVDRPQPHAIQ